MLCLWRKFSRSSFPSLAQREKTDFQARDGGRAALGIEGGKTAHRPSAPGISVSKDPSFFLELLWSPQRDFSMCEGRGFGGLELGEEETIPGGF